MQDRTRWSKILSS